MPRRRQLMAATGLAIVGNGVTSTSVSASSSLGWEGVRTEPPSGNVETQRVSAFNSEWSEDNDTGVWLDHVFVFAYNPDFDREEAEERFSEIDFTVALDGDELENPKQYFYQTVKENNRFRSSFSAVVPPRPPGEYNLYVEADKPDGVVSVEGTYEVTPGK